MAKLTHGYTFGTFERLTPDKLNALVRDATITGVNASDLAISGRAYIYGDGSPSPTRASIWYDDTPNAEGLRVAFCSASNASIARWLYMTPRRELLGWTHTAVSAGSPVFLAARIEEDLTGRHKQWIEYDGSFYPTITQLHHSGITGSGFPTGIAMESAQSGPVLCAWSGIIPAFFAGSNISNANPLAISPSQSNPVFRTNPGTRNYVLGVVLGAHAAPGHSSPDAVLWCGAPAIQDIIG